MSTLAKILIALLSFTATNVCAFQPTSICNRCQASRLSAQQDDNLQERRSVISKLVLLPFTAAIPALTANPSLSEASGGATAGGAYLLSAKKRYYERVKASVSGLLQAEDALKKGDSKVAKAYFSSEDDGSWKDLTSAGYLLSNAFRRSSSTAPDKLPAVQKYKAFAKEVDGFQKALKKKGAEAASNGFSSVEVALDEWLSEIELPPAREL